MFELLESATSQIINTGLIIIIGGLVVGHIIKSWIPDVALQNKYIPTVNCILGAAAGAFIPTAFTGDDIVTMLIKGAVCGLLASLVYDKVINAFQKKVSE